ncbi:EamA family transporter [Dactylosporangium aurantiacum]|uniref:EamA family transporter n=1 Tax=Dactylosporangium aurantiacum TaxID=35754 RepID=A0A9Q9MED9_9ACTN|nr:EamA family transporter [Dactylosporangium aurantiacum]MDG6102561.1 EamA family transporter [Dactylosporangium aurantiacum]UWZ53169.1 EamA family transporter [Dactylosporangium aurantiacum]
MKHRDVALAILVSAIWGVNFVVIHVGLDSMSPLLFCALRFGVAALPAVLLVGRPKVPWRWVIATGVALGVVKFSLLFAGMAAGLPSGLSALVLQSQVVFTLVFAVVLLRDRPGPRRLAGVALSGAGIVLIASQLGLDRPVGAFLLVIAAGAAWGLANIAMRKAQATDMLNFMVWVSAVATPPLLLLSLAVDGPAEVWHTVAGLDLTAVGAIAYIAYLSTLFGFGVWGRLIARYDAATVAPFAALAPVFAIVSAALLLGERIHWYDAAGGAAILGGVLLGAARVRPAPVPPSPGGEPAPRTTAGTAA